MALNKEAVIARLGQLNVPYKIYEHKPVLTVEAHKAELVAGEGTVFLKNIFIKDKKNRYFIITAPEETKVDLKILSARLGNGKGGIRMAPPESLQQILNVAQGCVNPFALCEPAASAVILLVDKNIKEAKNQKILIHPMDNTATIEISSKGLDSFLSSYGRVAHYIDIEANPVIDKDNPPDLKIILDSHSNTTVSNADSRSISNNGELIKGSDKKQDNKIMMEKRPNQVLTLVDIIIDKVLKLMKEENGKKDELEKELGIFKLDLEMDLNVLRNEYFSKGYHAAFAEMLNFCKK